MPEHECCNEAIKVDISYIKEGMGEIKDTLKGKANKWVEKFIYAGIVGVFAWAGNQVLDLIPKAYALIANLNAI